MALLLSSSRPPVPLSHISGEAPPISHVYLPIREWSIRAITPSYSALNFAIFRSERAGECGNWES